MSTLRVLIGLLFVLTFQNAHACTMVSTVFVTSPITCNGNCDGVVTLLTSGGTAPYVVNDPVTGGTTTYMGTTTLSGFCAGTYTFSITDATGCNNIQIITVTQPAAVDVSATTTNPSSSGASDGSIAATATGGTAPYVYSVNGGIPQGSGNFTGLPAGTYNVCAQDNNGCTSCETYVLTAVVSCSMVSTVFVTSPITCNGTCDGVVTLASTMGTPPYMTNNPFTGGGPVTYTSSTAFSGVCAGTYTFSITDAMGCNNVQVITVTQPAAISFTTSNTNPSTPGSNDGMITVNATGGTGSLAYSIDGGATYQSPSTFVGLAEGTYNVCVQDANGCQQCQAVTLTASSCTMVSTVFVTSPISCNGACDGVITLITSGGTPPYMAMTSTGLTMSYSGTTTITGLCAGTLIVNISDAAGCTNVQTIVLTQPTAVDVSATITNASSSGASDGSITATASGGSAPYVYSVNGGPQQPSGNFSGLPAGTYNVCAMDNNGCESCETFTVGSGTSCTMVSTVFVTAPITCNGACDGVVTLASTMGTPPYMTNNPFGSGTVTYTSSTTFSGVCPGVYTFSVTDAAGCNNIQVLTVTQPSAIFLASSATPVSSAGICDGSITPTASGGQAPYQYSIDGGITWGAPPFTGLCEGTYTVCVQDANGCIECDTVDLSSPSGMNELNETIFSLYPNPTTGKITIRSSVTNGRLMLTNVLGQPLVSVPMSTRMDLDLDAMGLENGVYFVNYQQRNKVVQTSRIVLSR